MNTTDNVWDLLIVSLSGAQGAARIRLWRSLRAAGGALLRDGVYLFPRRPPLALFLRDQQREVALLGGTALLFPLGDVAEAESREYRALFNRQDDYADWERSLAAFRDSLDAQTESQARRSARQLNRELQRIEDIDYFPGAARDRARLALQDANARLAAAFSPDEPEAIARELPIVRREEYINRVWATRARPWVDRLASAWLIRRFIDPGARFAWLAKIADCPKNAVGFDFDGAVFTHIGARVTFEVLLASFDLAGDEALVRIAAMVHGLDTGTPSIAEAAGFESVLVGARDLDEDDDELFQHASQTLDFLYGAFSKSAVAMKG